MKGISNQISDTGIIIIYSEASETFMAFKILETDYINYSILYTCDTNNFEFAWVFSRQEKLSSTVETVVNNVTQSHFNGTVFVNTCGNSPIISTVSCPKRQTVQDFRIKELAGEWFYLQQYGEYKYDCIRCSLEITDNKTNAFVVNTYGYMANSSDFSVVGQPSAVDSAQLIIFNSAMGSKEILSQKIVKISNFSFIFRKLDNFI